MRRLTIIFQIIIGACMVQASIAQIALKEFTAFREPIGEWVKAEKIEIDTLNPKMFSYELGDKYFVNGSTGKTEHLVTKKAYNDIELHIEFMLPQGSNSGIYFQGRYEIQVFDSWGVTNPAHSDCGGIYQRWDSSKPNGEKGYEGVPPRVNACKAPGVWQSYDIIFRAPRFNSQGKKIKNAMFEKVILNGIVIHENKVLTGPTRASMFEDEQEKGPLRLQGDHGAVAYRNIRIRDLENTTKSKPNTWVNLFENNELGKNYDFIVNGDATKEEANTMFEFHENSLKAMYKWQKKSAPYGIAITKKSYNSYDLKFEFQWGERRFEPRLTKKRDAGLLYHCQSGAYAWPPSLEYQIQEGDCGDLWNILGCHSDVIKDNVVTTIAVKKYSSSKRWEDHEKPGWNKVLIEVRGNSARYYLNGILVNAITNATYGGQSCTSGFIGFQAEYSEVEYRNIKIKELLD